MLFLSEERTNNTDCDCNQIQIIRVQLPTLRIAWLSDARSLAFLVRVLVRMRCSVLPKPASGRPHSPLARDI